MAAEAGGDFVAVDENEENTAAELVSNADWLSFFTACGIRWPTGSSVSYNATKYRFEVTTPPEVHDVFGRLLATLFAAPSQVQIGVEFVAFPRSAIDTASRCDGVCRVSREDLIRLREQGKARVLCAGQVLTSSGSEATVKSVREVIYPTEFIVEPVVFSTNPLEIGSCVCEPGTFETRETGTILTVLPEVAESGTLSLTFAPEWVDHHVVWKDYGSTYVDNAGRRRHVPMKQPFFHRQSIATVLNTFFGRSICFGGGTPTRDGSELVYMFVSADLVHADGSAPDRGRLLREHSYVRVIEDGNMPLCVVPWMPADAFVDRLRVEDAFDRTTLPEGGEVQLVSPEKRVKSMLASLGADKWPEGSSLRIAQSQRKLIVRNTRQMIEAIEDASRAAGLAPTLIEIELHFVAFDKADVEPKRGETHTVSFEALAELRATGKGELLFAPKVVTLSGSEATVKGVTEYIYPTEWPDEAIVGGAEKGGSNGSIAEPGSFETREVGGILTVLPELNPDTGLIALTLLPECVWEPEWLDSGEGERRIGRYRILAPREGPQFNTWAITTSAIARNGKPLLIGRAPHPKDETKEVFLFCRATLLDCAGNVIE